MRRQAQIPKYEILADILINQKTASPRSAKAGGVC
jgi:hypothetical protein